MMLSPGSEDGTVKLWDLRAPGYQHEYESRAAVNTVVLHPNQVCSFFKDSRSGAQVRVRVMSDTGLRWH